MRKRKWSVGHLFAFVAAGFALASSGCSGGTSPATSPPSATHPLPPASQKGSEAATPPSVGSPLSAEKSKFKSCQSSDPDRYCLALKYVVYKDSAGKPYADAALAEQDIDAVNAVWKQCGIAFQIEEYQPVDASDFNLDPGAGAPDELDEIRATFSDSAKLVLVTTGSWGGGATAGWTALPGGAPYGAIVEASISTYPEIMAHELGHYLNLNHVSDDSDLMNPVIYSTSFVLSSDQCATARESIPTYWNAMLRY